MTVNEQLAAGLDATPDVDAAAKILQRATLARIRACHQDITAALQKHACALVPQAVITPEGTIKATVQIRPKAT